MKDLQIKKLIEAEKKRQKKVVNLIASENYVSQRCARSPRFRAHQQVRRRLSGKRYYGGNEITDKIERLCMERALKLFKLDPNEWHVMFSLCQARRPTWLCIRALCRRLARSWHVARPRRHLTHGHKVSATGKFWNQVPYGIDSITETLNYDQLLEQAINEKPNIIVAGLRRILGS